MRRRALAGAGVAVTILGACYMGVNPERSPVVTSPAGTMVRVEWRGRDDGYWSDQGELLAISDSGVFLFQDRRVVFYPVRAPVVLRPRQAPGARRIDLTDVDDEELEKARPYARHPFGLSDARVLELARTMARDSAVVRRVRAP